MCKYIRFLKRNCTIYVQILRVVKGICVNLREKILFTSIVLAVFRNCDKATIDTRKYYILITYTPNRTRKLIDIRTDSSSYNRKPIGLSDQEPARNITLVWLCSRRGGWSGTGRATRTFNGCFLGGFLVALKFHLIHNWTHHHCILPQFFELFCIFSARIRFRSRIRSSSSIILIFKTHIRSTHKNEK